LTGILTIAVNHSQLNRTLKIRLGSPNPDNFSDLTLLAQYPRKRSANKANADNRHSFT
jgi:hypothetical protein